MNIESKMRIGVKELQEVLGIGESKAREMTHREGFPAIRDGKRILIPVKALERWLEEQMQPGKGVSA